MHDTEEAEHPEGAEVAFHAAVALAGSDETRRSTGDGLLVAAEGAMPLLGQGAGVLVQPIEAGLPAGFERIDINHASAGILRMPGRLAERLGELPADCDAVSALTRIALQAGVPQRMVPPQAREGAAWTLVRDEDEAHGLVAAWFRLHLGSPGAAAPGALAARALVRSLGPMLLHAGSGASVVTLGAGVLLLLALLAAWLGQADRLPPDARQAWEAARDAGVAFSDGWPDRADLVIDALLGLGVDRPLAGPWAEWSTFLQTTELPVLCVDLPTGLDADTGRWWSPAPTLPHHGGPKNI